MMQVLNKILLAAKKLSMAIRILFLQKKDLSSRPFLLFPKINNKSFLGNRIVQPVRSIDDSDAFMLIFRLIGACNHQLRICVFDT